MFVIERNFTDNEDCSPFAKDAATYSLILSYISKLTRRGAI